MQSRQAKAFLIFIIGVIIMASGNGCSSPQKAYSNYTSSDPQIGISMDFVAGWLHRESRGAHERYAQAVFFEPPKNDKSYKAMFAVNVRKVQDVAFAPPTAEGYTTDLIAKRMQLKNAKLASRGKITLLGIEGQDILFSYEAHTSLNPGEDRMIPVKERLIILFKDGKFYLLSYENSADKFAALDHAFYHCVKTLRLQ